MSAMLSTNRQGPTFATRPTMATAAGVKPPPKAAPADAPKPAKAAPADAPKPAAAAAKEKKRTARPTSLPEALVKKQLEIVRAGKPDAQTIPPEPLMPFPVPRYPCGTPAIFAAWASQHAESLPTYPDVGKGGTTGSEVAGVFVVCRNKVVGYVPGTAFLVRNKAGTEIVAHPAKFVGHAPQLDRGKLRESLVAMFASPKHDYIPTLADSLDFELAVKIRELIDADKSVLKSILPVAGGRDDGSPWKLPSSKEAVGTFYELLKDVAESIVAIKISKPRAARASAKTGSGDDDDDDDFMDVTVPVAPPATPPRKRPADDDLTAPPAKHKAVASAEDKPARAAPEKRKPAEEAKPKPKFTGRLLINGPETLFPQLQIPAQLFHEASDLFSSIGHAGFSSDPGTVSLTLTKTAVDADIRAKLDALTPEQRLLMASIVEPLALSQTTILDCSNQTDPVTVTQPDGSRVTGTIVATAPPPSELYAALLACRLTAAEWTIPPSQEEGQEHAEEDDDDDEDEDEDEEEEETAGDEEESAGDDDDEYDQ
jgi:hypothetical protein